MLNWGMFSVEFQADFFNAGHGPVCGGCVHQQMEGGRR